MPKPGASFAVPEVPANEEERLQELHSLKLLDTASEVRFDRYTSLVADIFGFPIVLVTFIDSNRQWFKSSCGLNFRETSRDISFCAHAISRHGVMVIPDTHADAAFAGNPLVTGPPYIRFYAGAVVHGPRGQALGTLCTIDHQPRQFNDKQCEQLRQFADLVENEIRHTYDLDILRAAVEFSAYYDSLTRLPNRRLLTDRLAKLIELAESDERQVAVLLFNISELRLINQSLGTDSGNEFLVQVGERLRSCCPLGGTVARLQADEFIMAFSTDSDAHDQIDAVTGEANSALHQSFYSNDGEHYLRVKIGGSVFPEHGATPAALIERASAAIRFTTTTGPGNVRFFSQTESVSISERMTVESHLRGALDKRLFDLVYQPIVSLRDGSVANVEALLRWHDPELGDVSPEQFIPIAEQTGLIMDIGKWVQDEVYRQLALWTAAGDWNVPVAINVAAAELLQPAFARHLLDQLEANRISPSLLAVEVTEYSLVSDNPLVRWNLNLLNEASVRINIDDFGTGYSSLAYLRDMPITNLKIDRSFIGGLPENKHEVTLTQTILSMADTLGLGTIAEGVETRGQLEFLANTHCRYVQGFLISKPVAAGKIPPLRGRTLI